MAEVQTDNVPDENVLIAIEDRSANPLSGRETAAILLMIFGEDEAANILSRLQPAEVQSLGEAMFAIRNVSEDDVNLVFDRFVEQARSRTTIGLSCGQTDQSDAGQSARCKPGQQHAVADHAATGAGGTYTIKVDVAPKKLPT